VTFFRPRAAAPLSLLAGELIDLVIKQWTE